MALEWVQETLREKLQFIPYPATLNLHPTSEQDQSLWQTIRSDVLGIPVSPPDPSDCRARLFPVEIETVPPKTGKKLQGAVLFPEVSDYPLDKIEVIAPVHLKETLDVHDGEQLTLVFL